MSSSTLVEATPGPSGPASGPETGGRSRHVLASAAVALSIGIFVADVMLPLGIATGVLYVAPVVLALFSPDERDAGLSAALGTVLTVLGLAISPAPLANGAMWVVIANRVMAIFAIWSTASAVWVYHRTRKQFQRMESQLAHSEAERAKSESLAHIGQMTASIAHEIKNPLAGMRGALQVIGARLPPDGADQQILATMCERIDHLHQSLGHMLAFGRPPMLSLTRCRMRDLLDESVRQLKQAPIGRELDAEILGDDCRVNVDRNLWLDVFGNLLTNSAQATNGRGRVVLTTTVGDDGGCSVAIADDGPGFDVELLDRMCEPFFTTKVRGSGLGFAIVKQTVERHRGTLEIINAPDGGAVVTIRLPRSARV